MQFHSITFSFSWFVTIHDNRDGNFRSLVNFSDQIKGLLTAKGPFLLTGKLLKPDEQK